MRFRLTRISTVRLLAGLMLAAFAVRALIPQGFMPSHAAPLSLEICPDGLPAQLLAHGVHRHPGGHPHSEHCVFGSTAGYGPVTQLTSPGLLSFGLQAPLPSAPAAAIPIRLVHLPQARGPPAA
jgi:hypothetical protein